MLKIFNRLEPFFEDCYRRINVREYARIMKISPPTASKILYELKKEQILENFEERGFLFFFANKKDKTFVDLSRIYHRIKLKELIDYLGKNLIEYSLILFGSLAKAEAKPDSDIDLAILSNKKDIDLTKFEKKLKRKIQLLWFNSFNDIKNNELKNNIINGFLLKGKIKI
jgi:predicted nucleotidyltransferase